jgi:hypothetical protein
VPFLRVTRDQRGYETTFLLHAGQSGARPRVLYWYRSAPGVRVGRPPLDEDAIRAIEDRYPDLDFDWPSLIEQSTSLPPEIERRPERPRRKAKPVAVDATDETPTDAPLEADPPTDEPEPARDSGPVPPPVARSTMLDELVGREIASRLRAQYAELRARLATVDPARRDALEHRASKLDPDSWRTPEEILHGVEQAEARADELRKEFT